MATRRQLGQLVVIQAITLTLFAVTAFLYINHVDRKNRQEWCGLITTLDEAYRANPPANETAERLAELMHQRRETLGC